MRDIRRDADWTQHLKACEDTGWDELPLLHTCPSAFRLTGEAAPRDLRGLQLSDVDLSDTDGLADSCMDFSILSDVVLDSANLTGASLQYARFEHNCVLDRANLEWTNLYHADLSEASMEKVDLGHADIRGANFEDCVLLEADLGYVDHTEEPWFGFLVPKRHRTWTRFGGEYQSASEHGIKAGQTLMRHLSGENLRWAFSQQHPLLGQVWYLLANYGRSPARLLFWMSTVWLLFGFLYAGYPLPLVLHDRWLGQVLCWPCPKIDWKTPLNSPFDFRPYYASAATMTSFGFGDIVSDIVDWKAQTYVCIESLLGYLMLAMFVTVLLDRASDH
jgi:hypothetical protein